MRGISARTPLPTAPAAMPNYVDHFRCRECLQWVYADDERPCPRVVEDMNLGWTRHCLHHKPEAKFRCDHCGSM